MYINCKDKLDITDKKKLWVIPIISIILLIISVSTAPTIPLNNFLGVKDYIDSVSPKVFYAFLLIIIYFYINLINKPPSYIGIKNHDIMRHFGIFLGIISFMIISITIFVLYYYRVEIGREESKIQNVVSTTIPELNNYNEYLGTAFLITILSGIISLFSSSLNKQYNITNFILRKNQDWKIGRAISDTILPIRIKKKWKWTIIILAPFAPVWGPLYILYRALKSLKNEFIEIFQYLIKIENWQTIIEFLKKHLKLILLLIGLPGLVIMLGLILFLR